MWAGSSQNVAPAPLARWSRSALGCGTGISDPQHCPPCAAWVLPSKEDLLVSAAAGTAVTNKRI